MYKKFLMIWLNSYNITPDLTEAFNQMTLSFMNDTSMQ